jgi:hypothetical protein
MTRITHDPAARTAAPQARFTLNAPAEAAHVSNFLRSVFLGLRLLGFLVYPFDLWVLGHWLDSWQSRIPFLVALPSALLTVLFLFFPRSAPVRTLFVVFSVLNMVTGLAGATFHLVFNFEGDVSWTAQGLKDAFEGTRPVLAAAAFAHIGFTGLLCSLLPALDPAGLSAADSAHPLSDLDTQK